MIRVWQGVIGAALAGAIVALVVKTSAGAMRIGPSARSAPADESGPGARRPVVRRPGGDALARGPQNRRPPHKRDRAPKGRKRKAKANVWTVPHGSGWANKREGAKRVAKVFPTKDAARAAGRVTAKREKVEHVILKRDGEIGERNSYAGDAGRADT